MIKIRCSELGAVMTNGRGKNAGMGETAKSLIKEMWIRNHFGRDKVIHSKEMTKGIEQEETSISLYTQVTGRIAEKNETNYENDWITGTPDIIHKYSIVDTKTAWDIFTFSSKKDIKVYEWQLRGYMMLLDKPMATIAYTLVSNPPQQISDALYRLSFQFVDGDSHPDYDREAEKVRKLMEYEDIAPELRLKQFHLERDFDKEEQIKARVEEAREYYKGLEL